MGIVAFLVGIVCGFYGLWCYAYTIAVMAMLVVILQRYTTRFQIFFWLFACACWGVLYVVVWDFVFHPKPFGRSILNRPVTMIADVVSKPQLSGRHGQRFQAQVFALNGKHVFPHPLVNVSVRSGSAKLGERYEWLVVLKPKHFLRNFSFDNPKARSAYVKGLSGVATVIASGRLIEERPITTVILRWRTAWLQRLWHCIGRDPMAGWVAALVLGFSNTISQDDWRLLRETGTAHLMAISGLHVGLVAAIVVFAGRWAYRVVPHLAYAFPAPLLPASVAWLGALFYSLLAGFSLSTRRCLMMLGVYLGYTLCRYPVIPHRVLLISALLECLWHPTAILTMGFWLSYGAVAIIFLVQQGRLVVGSKVCKAWHFNLTLWIGMCPLTAFFFGRVPWHAMACNLVAVPWVSFLILPVVSLGNICLHVWPQMGHALLAVSLWQLRGLHALLIAMNQGWWHGFVPLHMPTWPYLLCAQLAAVIWLLPRSTLRRSLACLWLLPCLFPSTDRIPVGTFALTVLDVGQGLSVLVRTQQHAMLIDAGLQWGGVDRGREVVVPALQALGIYHLDRVLISHGDRDHAGGLEAVLAAMKVKSIASSSKRIQQSYHAIPCQRGQHWEWDGVRFEVVWPDPAYHHRSGNNHSCVLRLCAGRRCALLPGDIEKAAEKAMLGLQHASIQADVLVAPHHGSQSSSSAAWLAAVRPSIVVYSTGFANMYHFPHATVVHRYNSLGVRAYNTALSGSLRAWVSGAGIQISLANKRPKITQPIWLKTNTLSNLPYFMHVCSEMA